MKKKTNHSTEKWVRDKRWLTLPTKEKQIKLHWDTISIRLAKNPNVWPQTVLESLWENRHTYTLLMEIQNGTAPMEENLIISSKITKPYTFWSSDFSSKNLA